MLFKLSWKTELVFKNSVKYTSTQSDQKTRPIQYRLLVCSMESLKYFDRQILIVVQVDMFNPIQTASK